MSIRRSVSPSAARHGLWRIWRMPLTMALLTVCGLLSALLGSGPWHWLGWLALAIPIGIGLWFAATQR